MRHKSLHFCKNFEFSILFWLSKKKKIADTNFQTNTQKYHK